LILGRHIDWKDLQHMTLDDVDLMNLGLDAVEASRPKAKPRE